MTWNELYERIARTLGKRRARCTSRSGWRAGARGRRAPARPLLTRDQLTMLEAGDNVVTRRRRGQTFGIEPIGLDEQLRRAA